MITDIFYTHAWACLHRLDCGWDQNMHTVHWGVRVTRAVVSLKLYTMCVVVNQPLIVCSGFFNKWQLYCDALECFSWWCVPTEEHSNKNNHLSKGIHLIYLFFPPQIGHIEGQPDRRGVFPMSFVHILSDWHMNYSPEAHQSSHLAHLL